MGACGRVRLARNSVGLVAFGAAGLWERCGGGVVGWLGRSVVVELLVYGVCVGVWVHTSGEL